MPADVSLLPLSLGGAAAAACELPFDRVRVGARACPRLSVQPPHATAVVPRVLRPREENEELEVW